MPQSSFKIRLRRLRELPSHPFLIASYFFAHLYATNAGLGLTLTRLARPYGTTLVFMSAVWIGLGVLFKSVRRSAILVSAGVLIFFSAGYVHGALERVVPVPDWAVMALFIAGWLSVSGLVFKKNIAVEAWTARANFIALILLAMPLSTAVLYHFEHHAPMGGKTSAVRSSLLPPRKLTPLQMRMPDVYYIIVDEYGHNDILKEVFNYDNSGFTDELKKMGFYIADQSRCNYMRTTLSIPSSLNMQYLDFIVKQTGPESRDTAIPFAMLRANKVARTFKSLGYQYLMTDSGISPMDNSPLADVVFSYTGTDEFTALLAKGTLMKGAAKDFMHEQQRNRHRYNFKQIETIPEMPGPKFSFLHFNMPHTPFVFDRDGNPSQAKNYDFKLTEHGPEYQKFYFEQLLYTNKVVLDLLRKILAKSARTPIIIVQSDHGLTPTVEWGNSETFVRQRGKILNAYLVPPVMRAKLYPSISPVNTFRLLFKTVYGAPIDLLEDRIYYSHYEDQPYVFTDVTGRFKSAAKEAQGDFKASAEPAAGKKP